jgi:hypothetical protein
MRPLILFIIASAFLACPLYAQSSYTVNTISTNGSGIYDISDDGSIAYMGFADGDFQVYLYKNGTTTQITHNSYVNGYHYIDYVKIGNNDKIVWTQWDYRTGGADTKLYLYSNGSTAAIDSPMGTSFIYCLEPRINNAGQVAWLQYDERGGTSGIEVFFYDGSVTHRLTTDNDKQTHVTINDNGWIAWDGDRRSASDWNSRVYLYNGSGTTIIASDAVTGYSSPQISNDNSVVYVGYNSSWSYYYRLYLYAGGPEQQVTDTSYSYLRPFHYKNGKLLISKNDLHIYQRGTVGWVKISPDTTSDSNPVGNGSYITWMDTNPMGYWRIDVYDGVMVHNLTGHGSYGYPVIDTNGDVVWSDGSWIYMASRSTTSISEHNEMPQSYELLQNYPNPINPSTVIRFSLPQAGNATLRVYDVLGKEITTLKNGLMTAGDHSVEFKADELGLQSGVYFYRLQTENFAETKKMVLVK